MNKNQEISNGYPLLREKPINVKSIKSVKRLLSRLITEFQQGKASDSYCRTLCYMLNTFVSIHKEAEFESAIEDRKIEIEFD